MKLAVVIEAGPGPESLAHALNVQELLLDRRGRALESIRLAVPRLFRSACIEAVTEEPDALVVAGGAKAARLAGQIAYEHGMPILFLPGVHPPSWARRLWGSLSIEDMTSALADGALNFIRLGVGSAEGQIFFGSAACGLIPQVAQLHDELNEAEIFSESWRALGRAASTAKKIMRPGVTLRCADAARVRGRSAIVLVQSHVLQHRDGPCGKAFRCRAWRSEGVFGYLGALARAARGRDWARLGQFEEFECSELTVDAGRTSYFVLDQEPIQFQGPVSIRFLPDAIRTYAFPADATRLAGSRVGWEHGRFPRQPVSHSQATRELFSRFDHWDE